MTLRAGVAGARGRLGRVACAAIDAADGMVLSAAFARVEEPGVDRELDAFLARPLDAVVDCTVRPATQDVARGCVGAKVPLVIGSSGWDEPELAALDAAARAAGVPVLLVPNFSFGAVLLMRFAEQAARLLPRAEIVELHHETKRDAPSGTARATAARIAAIGAPAPAIHSVRLPGLVAHQETIFGGLGEVLTLRHDTLSRDAFGPGIVAALRAVGSLPPGLTRGLDAVIDRMPA